jgi:hypothetical protein
MFMDNLGSLLKEMIIVPLSNPWALTWKIQMMLRDDNGSSYDGNMLVVGKMLHPSVKYVNMQMGVFQ